MTRIRTVDELNRLVSANIHRIRALPWDVVVHMPRSGTIPASLISTYLNAPLASVDEYCAGILYTRRTHAGEGKRILLVDDSFRTGSQMADAIAKIRAARPDTQFQTLVVYKTPSPDGKPLAKLDMYLCEEPDDDYLYPWFMWKSKRIKHCVLDFDGVLCRDAIRAEDDDGAVYMQFLKTAEPRYLPQHPVGAIVTARLERYRSITEDWLAHHNVKYGSLVMGPWINLAERKKNDVGGWKGQVFAKMNQTVFVESSLKQAVRIREVSGKTVWCTDTQEVII